MTHSPPSSPAPPPSTPPSGFRVLRALRKAAPLPRPSALAKTLLDFLDAYGLPHTTTSTELIARFDAQGETLERLLPVHPSISLPPASEIVLAWFRQSGGLTECVLSYLNASGKWRSADEKWWPGTPVAWARIPDVDAHLQAPPEDVSSAPTSGA